MFSKKDKSGFSKTRVKHEHTATWVEVFRIIPEFRILRLTFHRKSSYKYVFTSRVEYTVDHDQMALSSDLDLQCFRKKDTSEYSRTRVKHEYTATLMKVFRIIPEFRILRLTVHRKSASKC